MELDKVIFSKKDSGAVNYVRARMCIEQDLHFPNRTEKRAAKMLVIQHLGGQVQASGNMDPMKHVQRTVLFPDNTKAKF